jgi:hypothetical protein
MLETTTQAIHSNLTLDDDKSSLARLKREVMTILSAQADTNSRFQEEVKVSLGKMLERREEAMRSTRHGLAFEDAVCEYLERLAQQCGDLAERTGTKTGLIKLCKVGDFVLELGAESAAPGARVAIEVKEEAGFSVARAREECEMARKNRAAQLAVFVFSRKTAPSGLDDLVRYGDDIFVVWDAEDPASDLNLKAALSMARALCVREVRRSEAQAADFEAIDRAVAEIEKQAELLSKIKTWSETIRSSNEKILERVGGSTTALERQLELLREKLSDLKHATGQPET